MRAPPWAVPALLDPDHAEKLSLASFPSSPSAARGALSSRMDQQLQPVPVVPLRVVTDGCSPDSRKRVGKRARYHGSGVSEGWASCLFEHRLHGALGGRWGREAPWRNVERTGLVIRDVDAASMPRSLTAKAPLAR